MGCAEAVPDIAIDIAAIGAAAAAITIERRMILFMCPACPNSDRLKQPILAPTTIRNEAIVQLIVGGEARILPLERGLGITRGHAEARSFDQDS